MEEQQMLEQMGNGLSTGAVFGIVAVIVVVWLFLAYCFARLAKKTGMPFGSSFVWALIPIANVFLLLKIAAKPMWWFILFLIPVANLVVTILMWMAISERMGKPAWWGVIIGLVPFVNFVFFLILVFGESAPATKTA